MKRAEDDRGAAGGPGTGPIRNRPLRWRWALLWASAGVGAFWFSDLVARIPFSVERWYTEGLWPLLSRPLSLLTGIVPLSIAELLVVAYAAWTLAALGIALRDVITRRRTTANALVGGAHRILVHGGVVLVFFYAIWGLNYARPSFEARAGWPAWEGIEPAELASLSEQAVEATNAAYLELHGSTDAGVPTGSPAELRDLERAIDAGWARATELLALDAVSARRFGQVKWPLSSGLLAHLGISGVYVPFTGEATVLAGMPWMRAPLSMAHEKAHQRGVTTEAEATFLGFVATSLSPDPLARYAGALHASSQLLGSLRRADRAEWERLARLRYPGINRDLTDFSEYLSRYEGVPDRVTSAVNDRYLRANRVPGGIRSYSLSVRLLVEFARQQGGVLFPSVQ